MVAATTDCNRPDDRSGSADYHCAVNRSGRKQNCGSPDIDVRNWTRLGNRLEDYSMADRARVHVARVRVNLFLRTESAQSKVDMDHAWLDCRRSSLAGGFIRFQGLPSLLRFLQPDVRLFGRGDRVDAVALLDWDGGTDWRRDQFGD